MTETYFNHSNADGAVNFPETIKSSCKMVVLHLFQTRQSPLKDSFYNKAARLPGLCLQAPLTSQFGLEVGSACLAALEFLEYCGVLGAELYLHPPPLCCDKLAKGRCPQ